ncbi:MAG: GNAT family N-acetyltransferase [Acidobacteriota bacterium]
MRIRRARPEDWPEIFRLAQKYSLDYPGMEADEFWVAEEKGELVGIVGLKAFPAGQELCALGVEEYWRGRGLGRRLVRAILKRAGRDLYLATVVPGFFSRLGFRKAEAIPSSMLKDPAWCAGCAKDGCTVMVMKKR